MLLDIHQDSTDLVYLDTPVDFGKLSRSADNSKSTSDPPASSPLSSAPADLDTKCPVGSSGKKEEGSEPMGKSTVAKKLPATVHNHTPTGTICTCQQSWFGRMVIRCAGEKCEIGDFHLGCAVGLKPDCESMSQASHLQIDHNMLTVVPVWRCPPCVKAKMLAENP